MTPEEIASEIMHYPQTEQSIVDMIEVLVRHREEVAWLAARKVWYGHLVEDYNLIHETDLTYQSIEDWRKEAEK